MLGTRGGGTGWVGNLRGGTCGIMCCGDDGSGDTLGCGTVWDDGSA